VQLEILFDESVSLTLTRTVHQILLLVQVHGIEGCNEKLLRDHCFPETEAKLDVSLWDAGFHLRGSFGEPMRFLNMISRLRVPWTVPEEGLYLLRKMVEIYCSSFQIN
jgi:hypothetical protein